MAKKRNIHIIRHGGITSPAMIEPYSYNQIMSPTAMPIKKVKELYSQYRAMANKRLYRLEKAGLKEVSAARNWSKFAKIKELSERELRLSLIEAQKFLNLETSSVTGTREFITDTIENMRKKGIDIRGQDDVVAYIKYKQLVNARMKDDIKYEEITNFWNSLKEYSDNKTSKRLYNKLYNQARKLFYGDTGSLINELVMRL